jgi:hypothetical protein
VDFDLLLDLKFEQKKGTSLHTLRYKAASSLKQSVCGQYVCPSQLYILDIARGSTRTSPVPMDPNASIQFHIEGRTITRDFKRTV